MGKKAKKLSTTEKQMRDFLKAMTTMNNRIAQTQIPSSTIPTPPLPKKSQKSQPQMSMSPFPMPQSPSALCSRCGHKFKTDKPIKECPECGLTVAEEKDGELDWTEEMREPIPEFVYNAQSPEEIFYKSIKWHYDKWMKIHKNNPSASIGKI
jgi:ribosomal protein L37E